MLNKRVKGKSKEWVGWGWVGAVGVGMSESVKSGSLLDEGFRHLGLNVPSIVRCWRWCMYECGCCT